MKKYLFLLLVAVIMTVTSVSASTLLTSPDYAYCGGGEDKLTLKIKKVKKDKGAQDVKAMLMKVEGVKTVDCDSKSGIVTVGYDKGKVSCCKIKSMLSDSGYKNKEVACDGKKCNHEGKQCDKKCVKKT